MTSPKPSHVGPILPIPSRGPRASITQHTGQGTAGCLVVPPNEAPAAHLRTQADGGESETPRADHSRGPAALKAHADPTSSARVDSLVARARVAIADTDNLLRDSWRAVNAARAALKEGCAA